MNLFVIYIGGKHENSFIELHDMRFVIAPNLKDTYADLKHSWWGTPKSLHIDCWGILKCADGYTIQLKEEPAKGPNKLYFVNLGGYDPNEFTELHKNVFVVAPAENQAKAKALKQIANWKSPHRDYLFDVEDIFCLEEVAKEKKLHIHLQPTELPCSFEFTCKYIKI